ncbi:MAG: carbohydrate kinase family protein, partial [Ignavibacteria bacterium]|nr:carbohydrate kinase family protein [Ignavibacteria bacterium]
VTPVMNLGEDEFENVIKIFKKYPKIKTDGINKVSHPTRKVNLHYNLYNTDKKARTEKSSEPTYTLDYSQCESFLKTSDAILVNMISGIDITIETLKNIRKNFNGYIHIDIHNIVMDTKEDGSRVHKNVDDWSEWCCNSDTLQMNEFEIASLTKEKLSEYKIAEEILYNNNYNVKGIIVTRGKMGVTGFVKKEKSFGNEKFYDLDRIDIASIENPHFADFTGCGDVFASSFTIDYSVNKDFVKSMRYANRMASLNVSLEGIKELGKLK